MKPLSAFLAEPAVSALGWTLLHFLWQGALVAVLVACARGLLRDRSPALRYLAGCLALGLMLALPVATFLTLYASPHETLQTGPAPKPAAAAWQAGAPMPAALLEPEAAPDWQRQAVLVLEPGLPWLVAGWLGGVLLLSARLAGGWSVALRLRRRQTRPAEARWQEVLDRLRARLRVSRPVLLLESAFVSVPTVVGTLRPAILLPFSALCGLSPEQLEMILAHELGHIRRHDFLVNLLQSMIETLLFYHPAVWWVSSWVRIEREHCCDDLAIALCGNPLDYAHALTDLESWRGSSPSLAVAATGGVLLQRIRRLLGVPAPEAYPSSWPLAGTLVLLALSLAAAGGALLSKPEAQAAQTVEQPPAGPWVTILEGGRVLQFAPGRPVRIEGTGKLKIDTKRRLVELPEGNILQIGGRLANEKCVPRPDDVLRARGASGESFLDFRLGQQAAAKPEANVLGLMSLELDPPSTLALQFVEPYGAEFRSQPAVPRSVLGILMDETQDGNAQLITALPPDMPAARAGLRPGDTIVEIGGLSPATGSRLGIELLRRGPGEVLPLGILRDGVRIGVDVTLGDRAVLGPALTAFSKAHEKPKTP